MLETCIYTLERILLNLKFEKPFMVGSVTGPLDECNGIKASAPLADKAIEIRRSFFKNNPSFSDLNMKVKINWNKFNDENLLQLSCDSKYIPNTMKVLESVPKYISVSSYPDKYWEELAEISKRAHKLMYCYTREYKSKIKRDK